MAIQLPPGDIHMRFRTVCGFRFTLNLNELDICFYMSCLSFG